jgi:hypothetical protein
MARLNISNTFLTVHPPCLLSLTPGEYLRLPLTGAGIVASPNTSRNDGINFPSAGPSSFRPSPSHVTGRHPDQPIGVGEQSPIEISPGGTPPLLLLALEVPLEDKNRDTDPQGQKEDVP